MKDWEKKICDDILRSGVIIRDEEMRSDKGDYIRQYTIEVIGVNDRLVSYYLTKMNGEWIYIHCNGFVNK